MSSPRFANMGLFVYWLIRGRWTSYNLIKELGYLVTNVQVVLSIRKDQPEGAIQEESCFWVAGTHFNGVVLRGRDAALIPARLGAKASKTGMKELFAEPKVKKDGTLSKVA